MSDPDQAVLQRYAYAYDPAGNRTSEQIDDAVTSASYDALNRLVAQQSGGSLVFKGQLDEPATVTINGKPAAITSDNRFLGQVAVAPGTTTVTVQAVDPSGNAATAVYEVDQAGGGSTLTWDANGNLTTDGARTFEWDARDQLVAVTVADHRSEFTYDGQQRRVRIVELEAGLVVSDERYVWCGTTACEERSGDGSTVTKRELFQGEQVGANVRFDMRDHLGTVTAVTDTSGQLLARYTLDPWGRRTLTVGSDVTDASFTGHRLDSAAGIMLALYRAYDANVGAWISEDQRFKWKAGHEAWRASRSLFSYVLNNPTRWVEPLGLVEWSCNYTIGALNDVVVGAGYFGARCESDCVGGKKVAASVAGSLVMAGWGMTPVTLVNSDIDLKDPFGEPNPHNLEGRLFIATGGLSIGVGLGYTAMIMGAAEGRGAGIERGLDAGWGGYAGAVAVIQSSTQKCCK